MSDEPPIPTTTPANRLSAPAWTTRLAATPITGALLGLLLLAAALIFLIQNDRIANEEKLQQIGVQARVMAKAIAAPLAFDDNAALQEYINALRADPQVMAVGAYDENGRLVAGYSLPPAMLPGRADPSPPRFSGRDLIVTAQVAEGSTKLGSVYLRTALDSWQRRAARYLGIAVILLTAALLITLLGASYARLREAHNRLQEETANREKAEEALRQSQKMEALGQLTGGVAHDFNNLLMVASGGLDLMERTTDPVRIERLKNGIRQAVDRGTKLTHQLLAFARRSPLRSEVIDLGERIRGMDTLLDRSLGEGTTVHMDLPAHLWPVEVDPSQLEVAVLNIVINARDAMAKGGPIAITAHNLPAGPGGQDQVRLAIADRGAGIPAEQLSRIFEPFFTTKGVGKGTGLGLSQVYGFMRASGGEVVVDSVVGEGTTIALLLPRSQKPVPRAEPAGETTTTIAREAPRVLLVEDDDSVAETLTGMLGELGCRVERSANGAMALARLEMDASFALVLSDMIRPGEVSGIDLVRAIARRWPALPTMLMTGYSTAAAAAVKEGIRLLAKPFTIKDLAQQVEAAMAGKEKGE
jgi:signal transduction histidine kinase/ActR/RegA family two-component response regulator